MNTAKLILLLHFAMVSIVCSAPPTRQPGGISQDRMARVYSLLKNAEQMLMGRVVLSDDELQASARLMAADALKKECSSIVARCQSLLASPNPQHPKETFAFIKNACLRLIENREEPDEGHLNFAYKEPRKALTQAREYANQIRIALKTL